MSTTSLEQVWNSAAKSPFHSVISKGNQPAVGVLLLVIALVLSSICGINHQSVSKLALFGVPASLCFGFGAVYMICAVGVYV